jgi:hypothetical protein
MTSIQITDDAARCAVRFALWERVHNELGDGTGEFYDRSRGAIHQDHEINDGHVGLLLETLRDVERVQNVLPGETIDLEIPEDRLRSGLAGCSAFIVEDEGFWSWDRRSSRQRIMATFDAAQLLLGAEQEAVA